MLSGTWGCLNRPESAVWFFNINILIHRTSNPVSLYNHLDHDNTKGKDTKAWIIFIIVYLASFRRCMAMPRYYAFLFRFRSVSTCSYTVEYLSVLPPFRKLHTRTRNEWELSWSSDIEWTLNKRRTSYAYLKTYSVGKHQQCRRTTKGKTWSLVTIRNKEL